MGNREKKVEMRRGNESDPQFIGLVARGHLVVKGSLDLVYFKAPCMDKAPRLHLSTNISPNKRWNNS